MLWLHFLCALEMVASAMALQQQLSCQLHMFHMPLALPALPALQGEDSRHPPCELCGRRYPHEHIKAVYRSEQAADEDSDYEDGG
jgi:hypothetical protein